MRARFALAVRRLAPGNSIRRRLATGVGWSFVSTAVQQGMLLIIGVGLAQMLGPTGFGAWGLLYSTITTLGVFVGLGAAMTATKYVAEFRSQDPAHAREITTLLNHVVSLLGLVIALGLLVAAPFISTDVLGAADLELELRLASITLIAMTLFTLEQGTLVGFEAFQALARVNAIRAVVGVILSIGGGATFGVAGAVAGFGLSTALGLVLARRSVSRAWAGLDTPPASRSAAWRRRHVLWSFTVPAVAASTVVAPAMWMGNVYLATQPSGFAELGGFVAANQWRFVVTFVPTVIATALLPILASLTAKDGRRVGQLLGVSIGASALAALPVVLVLSLFGADVMRLHGAEFDRFATVLTVVAITGLLYAAQSPVGQVLAAAGHMWLAAAMNFGWALVFLVAAWQFVGAGMGAFGLALAYLVAYVFHSAWTFAYAALGRPSGRANNRRSAI